jgi:protein O-mannosyl-transferase
MAQKKQKPKNYGQKPVPQPQIRQDKSPSISGIFPLKTMRLMIVFFSILLYVYTLSFEYALDDTLMITSNDLTLKGFAGIGDIFSNDAFVGFFGQDKDLVAGGRYRPLTHAMFAIEFELFGNSPFVGHLMNLLLYAFLGIIVFETLRQLFQHIPPRKEWLRYIPFTATLLFLAHPLHTEVVANVKGRDEIISMAGSMLAVLFSLKYVREQHYRYLFYSFIALLTGIFSKENAITFVAIVPLTLWFFTNAKTSDYLKTIIPLLLASAIFIAARFAALGFLMNNTIQTEILNNPFINASRSEEIATVIFTWLLYVKLLFFPHPLTHDYYPWHLQIMNFSDIRVIAALIVVIGLIVLAALLFRKKHIVSYGILFFILTFSIQSNLLFNIGTFMNERFMFVALLGFSMITAYYFSKIPIRYLKKGGYLFLVVLFLYSVKTISRSGAWKDNYTLFTTDVQVSHNSAKCNTSAGELIIDNAEKEQDPAKAREMFMQAYEYLQKAQTIHPTYYGAYDLGGKAAFHLEDYTASFEQYKMCLVLDPEAPIPVNNIYLVALASISENRHREGEEFLLWLIDFAPDSLHYQLELANLLEKTGRVGQCRDYLTAMTERYPEYAMAWAKLGEVYGRYFNDLKLAEKFLLKSLSLNPIEFSSNENLGIVYGMQGNGEKSLEYFLKALAIDPNVSRLHTNIANTYMQMNLPEKAAEHFRKAEELQKQQK